MPTYAVIGAGAIGGYLAATLAKAGGDVTVVARGTHLAAMRERGGIRVIEPDGEIDVPLRAVGTIEELGPVEVAIVTLKAHQLVEFGPNLAPLAKAGTTVVGVLNGLPWWYFQHHGGPYEGLVLESVDPGGRLARLLPPDRVVGCVVYCSCAVAAPGVIRHLEARGFTLGQPDRGTSERTAAIAADFTAAGLKAPLDPELRLAIWIKLLGNASFNPISALTGQTLLELSEDELIVQLIKEMMHETVAIAKKLGITFPITIDQRVESARRVGNHKSSMLQDREAGKALELDALTGVIIELGERLGIPTPATRNVYALAKGLERTVLARR